MLVKHLSFQTQLSRLVRAIKLRPMPWFLPSSLFISLLNSKFQKLSRTQMITDYPHSWPRLSSGCSIVGDQLIFFPRHTDPQRCQVPFPWHGRTQTKFSKQFHTSLHFAYITIATGLTKDKFKRMPSCYYYPWQRGVPG